MLNIYQWKSISEPLNIIKNIQIPIVNKMYIIIWKREEKKKMQKNAGDARSLSERGHG